MASTLEPTTTDGNAKEVCVFAVVVAVAAILVVVVVEVADVLPGTTKLAFASTAPSSVIPRLSNK